MAGPSLGWDTGEGTDPGERVRCVWGPSRRWWRHVRKLGPARASQEGAQPWGGAAGTLLSQNCCMDAAGLHTAIAYGQIPPAKLIFLQPELHREVHACMCRCSLVFEGPPEDERGRKRANGRRQRKGRRWKQPTRRVALRVDGTAYTLSPFQQTSPVGLHVAGVLNLVLSG